MQLRANPKDNNFPNYHSGLHSVDHESTSTNPEALTQPQKEQISESLDCYLATKISPY